VYISIIMLEVVWCITSDTMNKLITDYVAVDLDDRPSSLVECLAMDGLTLDPLKYWQYQDKEDELGDLVEDADVVQQEEAFACQCRIKKEDWQEE
jgi:hypothetical protein